jgi:alpha-beta hydrolase superfamily lysophospholipase
MIPRLILALTSFSLLTGCAYFRTSDELPDQTGYILEQIKLDMKPLNAKEQYAATSAIQRYFTYYDLSPTNTAHYFGTVESQEHTLAAHAFIPENPIGTLFLIHGYFDHTGTLSKLIKKALEENYAVAVWDLPGHGLSTGARTDTDSFNLCARQFTELMQRLEPISPEPIYVIAHSTGCSIAIEYMYNADGKNLDGYVFLAPLVRHTHWGWAKFGYSIAKPFKKTIRRRKIINSSDEEYLAFVKQDPLHSDELSLEYLTELYKWEKQVQNYPTWHGDLLIVQGDQDDILDWKYNLTFLKSRIPDCSVNMIPGARHQLANESEPLRDQTFDVIFNYLDNQGSSTEAKKVSP